MSIARLGGVMDITIFYFWLLQFWKYGNPIIFLADTLNYLFRINAKGCYEIYYSKQSY